MIDVLVLDDSALMRSLLREIVDSQPDMRVVGAAADPYAAREMIKQLNPHVLTLDVELPKMNGLDFLEKLMRLRPMAVVMISSLTAAGSESTLRALELGAIDFVAKPALGVKDGVLALEAEIVEKIRIAAAARVTRLAPAVRAGEPLSPRSPLESTEKIVVVGASTGGTKALAQLVSALPADAPAMLIAQHMPEVFTNSFAQRLDAMSALAVKEAAEGERILPGHAYIAPGGMHLRVAKRGSNYVTAIGDDAPVNRHRPSVDALFLSAAASIGKNAIGVIMTGMGSDGAAGIRALHDAGAATIAQSEASCVVFGMPKSAIATGGVDVVVDLDAIAGEIYAQLSAKGGRAFRT